MTSIAITTNNFCRAFFAQSGFRVYLFDDIEKISHTYKTQKVDYQECLIDISTCSCVVTQIITMMQLFERIPNIQTVRIICSPTLNKMLTILFARFFSSMRFHPDKLPDIEDFRDEHETFYLYRDQSLTPREFTVLHQLMKGASNLVLAKVLGISNKTVSTYRNRAMSKLGHANLNLFIHDLHQISRV